MALHKTSCSAGALPFVDHACSATHSALKLLFTSNRSSTAERDVHVPISTHKKLKKEYGDVDLEPMSCTLFLLESPGRDSLPVVSQ